VQQHVPRLEPIADDDERRYRCPKCKGAAFEDANKNQNDAAALEVRRQGPGWEVREPVGGSTTYARVWRPAPRGLICLGPCHDQPQDHWSIYDTHDDGHLNPNLL
jgi:hypothetical protein